MPNELLFEGEIYPDGSQIKIEDPGTADIPEGVTEGAAFDASNSSVSVYTMSADEAETIGRDVMTRVYRGTDPSGLGNLIFDQTVTFTQPFLGVGEILHDEDDLSHVPLEHAGPIRLQIFTDNTINTVTYSNHGERPISGPSDVNILIRYDLS
ncbi:Uncharacterised protein [Mycobacteroides abscessus subsp. abscessus]|uniref:hypothetical protein n=1 Tax=Mycobacteroides abscessus TaxID=36809 RepID=UPI00092C1C34|nr:hypothetical protein [Mycobacteroides abscessus]SID09918.1 Uncharacterised protein [Mycobacteroides abscessus subsp. abscessus]SKU77338.1 Uncharacterised protein [Mycobacteroides abscessus subsp. abscessus]